VDEIDEISGEELDVDLEQIREGLGQFRQGDVLDVGKLTWLYSPDSPNHPHLIEGVPADEPVMTQEVRTESRLAAIVSQTCDLRQLPDVDQWVLLAPLQPLAEDDYRDALHGRSVRFFSYPTIPGHKEQERLALDARIIVPLEKMALLSKHIEHIRGLLSEPRRDQLSTFLGNRLGRRAFSDEITNQLIRPLEAGIKRVARNQGFRGFFDSVVYFGVEWTPGKAGASLLALTSQHKREVNKVNQGDVEAVHKRLQDSVTHRLQRSSYEATVYIRDAEEAQAVEILARHQLFPDLHGAILDE
jgi:hypothetical protein